MQLMVLSRSMADNYPLLLVRRFFVYIGGRGSVRAGQISLPPVVRWGQSDGHRQIIHAPVNAADDGRAYKDAGCNPALHLG